MLLTAAHTPLGSVFVRAGISSCNVSVAASIDTASTELLASVMARAPEPVGGERTTEVDVWHRNRLGPDYTTRQIAMPAWSEISELPRAGCPPSGPAGRVRMPHSRRAVDSSAWASGDRQDRRTGTHARWNPWCQGQYVADPEWLFQDLA